MAEDRPEIVSCPFCGEPDFDLPGLTMHLNRQWCEASKSYCSECGVLMKDTFFHFKHCSHAAGVSVPGQQTVSPADTDDGRR